MRSRRLARAQADGRTERLGPPAAPIATRLAAVAARERILITPGPSFSVDGTFERHVRLPFCAPPEELRRAVESLNQLAGRLGASTVEVHDPLPTAV
jgi:DNA-binding transcriptional MocR family regulator